MPENRTEEELNRKKRTVANRDMDTIVTTTDDDKDIYSSKVFDFLELVENSTIGSAVKLRNLKEYGVTDEMILATYKDLSGSVETEEAALAEIETIFRKLATYVTELPNGIVIDLATGLKDEEKSFEQAVNVGIYSEDSFADGGETIMMKAIEDYGIKNINSDSDMANYILEFSPEEYMTFYEIDTGLNGFLEKDEEDMNLSEDLKEEAKDSKKIIERSPYETDMHLFEITKLYVRLKETENTQDHNIVLSQIQKFYENHKDYIGKKIPVMNADGTLNVNEVAKLDEYSEAYEKMIMLEHFDMVNGLTKEELTNLPSNEKKHVMLCAFAGLRYKNNPNERTQSISKEARKMIEKIYPNLDLSNGKNLAEFLKQEMGFKGTLESVSLEELIESYSLQLKKATEKYIIEDLENYVGKDVNLSKVDLDSGGRRYVKDPMKNYFIGSKIKFSETDKNSYDELYRTFTVDAWIDKKDDAIKFRYQALHAVLEDYKKAKSNPYIESKIEEIENNISEFEKQYGKMNFDENDVEFDTFRQNFVNAGLTKYLTRDTLDWQDGVDYKDLDSTHKKGYMRNILVCLDYIGNTNKIDDVKFPISKLALRRLELMNSKDKQFITFDDNGGFKINEQLILEEYKGLSEYKYGSFEELKYSAGLRKNEYLLRKLDEYTKLPASAFVGVEKDKPVEAIKVIDQVRTESNQVRINNFVKNKEKSQDKPATPKIEEKKPFDSKVEGKKGSISDADFKKGISFAELEVSEINIAEEKAKNAVRETKIDDQTDINERAENIHSELKNAGLGVAQIDVSAIDDLEDEKEDNKPNFIEKLKNAFNTVKNFISKHIRGKEKVELLESGEIKNVTAETKKMDERSDFNTSILSGISLQEQQDYSKKQQMQTATVDGKDDVEQGERT